MDSDKPRRSVWGAYTILCMSHMFMHVFTQMHISLIPILRVEFGLDILEIGFIASIPLFIQAILTIPGGLLADRVNRLRLIASGLLISGLGGILMMWASNLTHIILIVSLFSISATVLHPPALSIIGDLVSGRVRGKALGFFGSSGTLGIALGPITLSFLMNVIGWRFVYLTWSVPALLVPLLIIQLKLRKASNFEEKYLKREKVHADFRMLMNLTLFLVLIIMAVRSLGGIAINTYITPYFVDVIRIESTLAILIFGLNPLIGVFASSIGGVVVDKVGERKWLALGFTSQILSLLIVAFTTYLPFVIIGYISYSFFGLTEMPATQSVITRLTPKGNRGLVFAVSFLPYTIVGSFSPIMVALIADVLGIWYIFPYSIIMFVVALIIVGFIWKRIK